MKIPSIVKSSPVGKWTSFTDQVFIMFIMTIVHFHFPATFEPILETINIPINDQKLMDNG